MGISDGDSPGIALFGIIGTATPTSTTPAIILTGNKKNVTDRGVLATTDTALRIDNYTTQLLSVLGSGEIKYLQGNSTGAGAALLGSNAPTAALSAPYTWVDCRSADGTACIQPIWAKT